MKSVNLLDCTIRDGSYVTNNTWTDSSIIRIVKHLSKSCIKYIEVGNGTGMGTYRSKQNALVDAKYYENSIPYKGNSLIGTFCIPDIATFDDLLFFKSMGGDFVRVGVNATETEKAIPYISKAKELGFFVCCNLMKTYAITKYQLVVCSEKLVKAGVDCIYIVDSAGGMIPDQVADYVSALQEFYNVDIGFHGHNNLLLANANSLKAAESGALFIDTTLGGLGRGAGNAQTESMIAIFKKVNMINQDINIFELADFSNSIIGSYKIKGSSKREINVGNSNFHDSYTPLLEKTAQKYQIDADLLMVEVCKINIINPSLELFDTVARHMAAGKSKDFFATKYHYRIN